ncbi:MAG: PepSY domain-containing protein [Proteobacteria bacterium]|nr:PepSY domain-containing protein [Pseudomonadota bacterium]
MCKLKWMVMLAMIAYASAHAQILVTQSVSTILKNLQNQGYIAVKQLQLEGDQYFVQAISDKGEAVNIAINSHSGEIMALKKIDVHLPMLDVVEKVEALGYTGITYIQSEDGSFIINAVGPSGEKSHLQVNATTGEIAKIP